MGQQDPAFDAIVVTPNDGADLSQIVRGIYVGGGGNLRVTMVGGATVTFVGVTPGIWPLEVSRVWATGTTVTNLIGLV